jgi:hypothetical protein
MNQPMNFATQRGHMDMTADSRNFQYVDCDIPPGVSLATWRAQRSPARRRSWLRINRLVRADAGI